jgi:hypothetical protein
VAFEVSLHDEVRHYGLREYRWVHICKEAHFVESVNHGLWDYDIAKSDSRKNDLAECAGVDHGILCVKALQCREWPIRVAEFAVVVVLQYPRARFSSPAQQFQPARKRHRDPERKLVRRRDKCHARVRRLPHPFFNLDALAIDRNGHHAGTGGNECAIGSNIAGIFEPNRVSRIQQHARRKVECLLRPVDDEYLFRITGHSTCTLKIGSNGRAKRRIAWSVAVVQRAYTRSRDLAPSKLSPDRSWKLI